MPLVSGGPPQWAWERSPDPLKWEVVPFQDPKGDTTYELRVNCGLEIVRLQFFTADEIKALESQIVESVGAAVSGRK
jgi:hypothetical protein